MRKAICPVCYHEEAIQAKVDGVEPMFDDLVHMDWIRPHGAGGQIVTVWSGGHWKCWRCEVLLPARHAMVLIDAALRASDPEPDEDVMKGVIFADAAEAAKGGSRL